MNFSEALKGLREGKLVRRECWQNQEVFLEFRENERKVLIMDGRYEIKYEPSDADLIAEDWQSI